MAYPLIPVVLLNMILYCSRSGKLKPCCSVLDNSVASQIRSWKKHQFLVYPLFDEFGFGPDDFRVTFQSFI